MSGVDAAQVGRVFREESGRSLATLIRIFGQIDLAEDAVQEAFALAVHKWPQDGLPPNPGGWITTTARNRATDSRGCADGFCRQWCRRWQAHLIRGTRRAADAWTLAAPYSRRLYHRPSSRRRP